MADNITNIEALNKVLKGEYMAIATYENYIQKVTDHKLSAELDKIVQDHKNHAFILSCRIRELGQEPIQGTGVSGLMADLMNSVKAFAYTDKQDILSQLYGGENKGISAALDIAEQELLEYDKQLVEEMMSEDYTHLKKLSSLIASYSQNTVH